MRHVSPPVLGRQGQCEPVVHVRDRARVRRPLVAGSGVTRGPSAGARAPAEPEGPPAQQHAAVFLVHAPPLVVRERAEGAELVHLLEEPRQQRQVLSLLQRHLVGRDQQAAVVRQGPRVQEVVEPRRDEVHVAPARALRRRAKPAVAQETPTPLPFLLSCPVTQGSPSAQSPSSRVRTTGARIRSPRVPRPAPLTKVRPGRVWREGVGVTGSLS